MKRKIILALCIISLFNFTLGLKIKKVNYIVQEEEPTIFSTRLDRNV